MSEQFTALLRHRDRLWLTLVALVDSHDFKSFGNHAEQAAWNQARDLIAAGKPVAT